MSKEPYQITIKFSRQRRSEIKLIEWLERLKEEDYVVSAKIKTILLNHIEGGNQLDRIEAMLNGGQFVGTTPSPEEDIDFNDRILDSNL